MSQFQDRIFPEQKRINVSFMDDFHNFSSDTLYITYHEIDNQFYYDASLKTMRATFNTTIIDEHTPLNPATIGSALALRLWKKKYKIFIIDIRQMECACTDFINHIHDIASGFKLTAWDFHKYKQSKPTIEELIILSDQSHKYAAQYPHHLIESSLDARELRAEPANILTTTALKDKFVELGQYPNVSVEVFDVEKLKAHKMHGILAVGQGSDSPPYMVVVKYNWHVESANKVALVGKGVVFDTGGVSLKQPDPMIDMNGDMGGAAAAYGTLKAMILNKSTVPLMVVVAIVENMPSGKSYRPNDILTSPNGSTIEVLNTDAEGRIILQDALYYAGQEVSITHVYTIATLTGMMRMTFGCVRAGIFSNDTEFAQITYNIGEQIHEKIWIMPLDHIYITWMKSEVADICNISTGPKLAGSITAAGYLSTFVNPKQKWVHIDIAGVNSPGNVSLPLQSRHFHAFGVRLLYNAVHHLELHQEHRYFI